MILVVLTVSIDADIYLLSFSPGLELSFRNSKLARERTQRNKKIKRFLLVGAAGGVGGVLIGMPFLTFFNLSG